MKTLNELYTKVLNSEELKNEFLTLKTPEDIVAFAAKHGCTATLEEIENFFKEKAQNASGELSEEELAQVAGGKGVNGLEAALSIISVGIGCGVHAIESAVTGRSGTAIKGKAMLCAEVTKNGTEFDSLSGKELK